MPIVTLRQSIVDKLSGALAGVNVAAHPRVDFTTEDLNEALKNRSLALRVSFGGVLDDVKLNSDEIDTPTAWTVFVATKDVAGDLPRDVIALKIIPRILAVVARGRFEMPRTQYEIVEEDEEEDCERETLHRVRSLRSAEIYRGEVDTKSAMVWAVQWRQTMSIAPDTCDDIRPLLTVITRYDLAPKDGVIDASDTISMRSP